MKTSAIAVLLLSTLSMTRAQDQPCAAGGLTPSTTKVVPCGAPPVATAGGEAITLADLDEATRAKVAGLDAAVAETRKKALRAEIDDTLLRLEAERRGVTVGQLLATEVRAKVAHPTEAEVAAEMASNPKKYKKGKEYEEWAAGNLFDARQAERQKELLAQIEKRFPVTHGDDPARAMIGTRKLDAAAARLRMETAAADVRISVASEEKNAIQKVANNRALHVLVESPQRPRQRIDVEHAPSIGPSDAKVTFVEFGDFECPPCGQFAPVIDEVLQPYAGRVRFVFMPYPLSAHAFAWKAAEAALAARAQGKFFPYAHHLFTHQKELDVESLKRYATELGLDRKRFDEDLDSGRFAAEVIETVRQGKRVGVWGTPSFFINGAMLPVESYNVEAMRAAIDAALAGK